MRRSATLPLISEDTPVGAAGKSSRIVRFGVFELDLKSALHSDEF